ncbi:TetR/AcrR family transcriptional regulator [Halostella litorea]|uniref:TetR/AcrR family transcriptional regulator n=1 Tax=Halostella litorea TaxID=2528831 RepID=UPI0010925888|nr:TetR/AcrR family transcriptional regulator [Halostella litorea]
MTAADLFDDDPPDTRAAIMRATYEALREHGYAGLTVQRIADEFPKSKSLLYHHYDGKDDLLRDLLGYVLDHHRETVPAGDEESAPETRLRDLIDYVLTADPDPERAAFRAAMVELRGQAAHDREYRDHFTESDRFFQDRIAAVVGAGVDSGAFRDVDPDRVAAHVQTTFEGALVRSATADSAAAIDAVRADLHRYVDGCLLAEGAHE